MNRRRLLEGAALSLTTSVLEGPTWAKAPEQFTTAWYERSRRYVSLPPGRIAYVEHGRGPAALFLHGFPLNGYQWRGALERLHPYRRCVVPDLLSMGYTQAGETQVISPEAQVDMLGSFLDRLRLKTVDIVANDSGGLVAQLFLARFPSRVRTLLLTNCDVDENNPPTRFLPAVALAKKGLFTDRYVAPQGADKALARSPRGIGAAFTYPDRLADETIDIYFRPILESPLRKRQLDQYAVSMGSNALVAVREDLHRWTEPARMVWGLKDSFFDVKWADWLDHSLPGSRGVLRLPEANLFFPEEMPDVIAREAKSLWGVG
jgi:haloalkane dehalogenase